MELQLFRSASRAPHLRVDEKRERSQTKINIEKTKDILRESLPLDIRRKKKCNHFEVTRSKQNKNEIVLEMLLLFRGCALLPKKANR